MIQKNNHSFNLIMSNQTTQYEGPMSHLTRPLSPINNNSINQITFCHCNRQIKLESKINF